MLQKGVMRWISGKCMSSQGGTARSRGTFLGGPIIRIVTCFASCSPV